MMWFEIMYLTTLYIKKQNRKLLTQHDAQCRFTMTSDSPIAYKLNTNEMTNEMQLHVYLVYIVTTLHMLYLTVLCKFKDIHML